MQSSNPILTRAEAYADAQHPMTVQGAIRKSVGLTVLAATTALALFVYILQSGQFQLAYGGALIGLIGSLILGLVITFKPKTAPSLSIPYAILEGAFMGGVSAYFQARYPGVPFMALLATFATSVLMFGLYRFRIIKATEKFKSVVISASLALFVIFLVQMVLSLAFGSSIPGIFEMSGPLALGFAAFVAVIASLNLILDFDLIENAAANQAPKYMEWLCGVALLATLVWMYVSFLRLLGILSADD